jgi:hypothetical protein
LGGYEYKGAANHHAVKCILKWISQVKAGNLRLSEQCDIPQTSDFILHFLAGGFGIVVLVKNTCFTWGSNDKTADQK